MTRSKLIYVAVIFIMSFLFCQKDLVADQLEDAYKKQYERYTTEIENLQKSIKSDEDSLEKAESFYNNYCIANPLEHIGAHLYKECDGVLTSRKVFTERLETDRPKLMEVEAKKQELKIKILETKGTLPNWWTK